LFGLGEFNIGDEFLKILTARKIDLESFDILLVNQFGDFIEISQLRFKFPGNMEVNYAISYSSTF